MATSIRNLSSKSKEIHDSTIQASEIADVTNNNAHSTTLAVNQSVRDIQQLSAMLEDSAQAMSKLNEGTDIMLVASPRSFEALQNKRIYWH